MASDHVAIMRQSFPHVQKITKFSPEQANKGRFNSQEHQTISHFLKCAFGCIKKPILFTH
jgi:hypothetical protein